MQFVKFWKKNEIKKFRSSTYLPTYFWRHYLKPRSSKSQKFQVHQVKNKKIEQCFIYCKIIFGIFLNLYYVKNICVIFIATLYFENKNNQNNTLERKNIL